MTRGYDKIFKYISEQSICIQFPSSRISIRGKLKLLKHDLFVFIIVYTKPCLIDSRIHQLSNVIDVSNSSPPWLKVFPCVFVFACPILYIKQTFIYFNWVPLAKSLWHGSSILFLHRRPLGIDCYVQIELETSIILSLFQQPVLRLLVIEFPVAFP